MYINLINFDDDSSFLVDLPLGTKKLISSWSYYTLNYLFDEYLFNFWLKWLNWNVHDSIESTEIFNISDIL